MLTPSQELDLANNVLTSVGAEIGNLKSLQRLDISGNKLLSLPHEIGLCTDLPVEMGQLTRLKLLDLEYNSLIFPPRKKIAEGTDAILLFLRQMQADRDKNAPKSPRR